MVLVQLAHAFNCRSERYSLFSLGVGTNLALVWAVALSTAVQVALLTVPAVAAVFKVSAVPLEDWALMAAVGILPLVIVEIMKLVRTKRRA
jgi:Ca2+-transporting ATPase